MEETEFQPALALKEVDSREAEDERQQKKNGVHTGAFLQNPHVESAGVLPGKIVEISVAGQQHRDERVHQKENNPGVCAPLSRWRRRDSVWGRASHIAAVIMLYERLRREEFLRDYCKRGALILAEEGESVAAGLGEIDGTDKRDRYQNN